MEKRVVTLTEYEIYMGASVGTLRTLASLKRGETNKVQNRDFGWHSDIESACSEIAFAKYSGIYWGGSVNTFKAPDVGLAQVRHTQHKTGRLIIRHNDSPTDYYVLVIGTHPDYTVHGYILGSEGMKDEYLDNPIKTEKGEAFFVPQRALLDIDDLVKLLKQETSSNWRYAGQEKK